MGRALRRIVLLAVLAAAGWTAAPALSVDRYMPSAEDFDAALPAVEPVPALAERAAARDGDHAHPGEGPVSHRSAAFEAPKRFDLAGIAGELRPYELRARLGDGEWSEWVETGDGNPVYFGGADRVQVRARGWRPSGRLHYVNVSGSTSAGERILNGARRAVNGAFISASGLLAPAADASPVRPEMVSRGEWGATQAGSAGCRPRRQASMGLNTRAGVVHHTVTASNYTRAEAPGIVLGICRFHRNGNGWDDIGYNALTDRFGTLYVGRAGGAGRPVIGAHAQGFNRQTTGIAVLGTHTDTEIPAAARQAFGRFLAWRLRTGKALRGDRVAMTSLGGEVNKHRQGKRIMVPRIIPHLRLNRTACPGDTGRGNIGQIRTIADRIRTNHE